MSSTLFSFKIEKKKNYVENKQLKSDKIQAITYLL